MEHNFSIIIINIQLRSHFINHDVVGMYGEGRSENPVVDDVKAE